MTSVRAPRVPSAHSAAADLPDGSVVATNDKVWIKNNPSMYSPWRTTAGSFEDDRFVQDVLDSGRATVLRVGTST